MTWHSHHLTVQMLQGSAPAHSYAKVFSYELEGARRTCTRLYRYAAEVALTGLERNLPRMCRGEPTETRLCTVLFS